MVEFVQAAGAWLLLDSYSKAEADRLDAKASIMRAGKWDARAEADDALWRRRNAELLAAARERVSA